MLHDLKRAFALRIILGSIGIAALFTLVFATFAFYQSYRGAAAAADAAASHAVRILQQRLFAAAIEPADWPNVLSKFVLAEQRKGGSHLNALALVSGNGTVKAFSSRQPDILRAALLDWRLVAGDGWRGARADLIGGRVLFLVTRALAPNQGRGNLFLRGSYAIAPEAFAAAFEQLGDQVLKIIIASLLVGLVTGCLLYPILIRQQQRLIEFAQTLLDGNIASLKILGNTIAKRDSATHAHNFRVTIYAIRIAEHLELRAEEIQDLIKGAFLHDVGKIGIRDDILMKQGELSASERAEMNRHVEYGADIIKDSVWLAGGRDVVRHHHEKFDGSGFPLGLAGQDIPIGARIFAVADVFDALMSQRPYKAAFSMEKSVGILEAGRHGHFDPKVLDAFSEFSEDLHQQIGALNEADLDQLLDAAIEQYFTA